MNDAFIGIPELEGLEPIGELPRWIIQRAINETSQQESWAYEFVRQVPGSYAVYDWDGNVLVLAPERIERGGRVIEPGWYYMDRPDSISAADFAFLDNWGKALGEAAAMALIGRGAGMLENYGPLRQIAPVLRRMPLLSWIAAGADFGLSLADNAIATEALGDAFSVRKPDPEARELRLAELAIESERRRMEMLQSIAASAQQIGPNADGYERNRALVDLQDAINDYTLFYGGDPAAMAAVRPYQEALARLWQGGQQQMPQPALMTVPGVGYTGVDVAAPAVIDDNYDRFRANPSQPTPGAVEPAATPEQYFSRAYQTATPFRAENVVEPVAPMFTDPRIGAPYTGADVVAPTLRDNGRDRFRATALTMPSTGLGFGQPTSAMDRGAYAATLPAFDFGRPLGRASQSTTAGFGVPVTPLQFGMVPTLKSAMSALPSSGFGGGVPVTPPTFSWSPLAQPSFFDAPTRVAAKATRAKPGARRTSVSPRPPANRTRRSIPIRWMFGCTSASSRLRRRTRQ